MFSEDLSKFFDTAGFAQAAVLDGADVEVIFDDSSIDVLNGVITANPSVLITSAQAASAAAGQSLTIGAAEYTVRSVMSEGPDGAVKRLDLVRD